MKRFPRRTSFLMLVLLALPAVADVKPLNSVTQADMDIESGQNAKKADVELNKVYTKLMATMLDDKAKEKLTASERLWVKFRGAECESAADDYRGGSIVPLVYNQCFERLTNERTDQLNSRFQP